MLQVHRLEQAGTGELGFRLAEEQDAVVAERVVQPRQHHVLGLGLQVDQQVPADQQVDAADGRVMGDVVAAEDHALPQVAREDVVVVGALEVALQQVGRNALDVARRIGGVARGLQRRFVEVGGVDLDLAPEGVRAHRVGEEHGQAVWLLAGGAADAPHPDRPSPLGLAPLDDAGHDGGPQHLPRLRVAEEGGDVDQHRVQQVGEFLRVRFEEGVVRGVALGADRLHAVVEAPAQARLLVAAEIDAPAVLDVPDQLPQVGLERVVVRHAGLSFGSCPD